MCGLYYQTQKQFIQTELTIKDNNFTRLPEHFEQRGGKQP